MIRNIGLKSQPVLRAATAAVQVRPPQNSIKSYTSSPLPPKTTKTTTPTTTALLSFEKDNHRRSFSVAKKPFSSKSPFNDGSRRTTTTSNDADGANGAMPTQNEYERIANETLESLTERFDDLIEELADAKKLSISQSDVEYSSGVLNLKLGGSHGTYVLNMQKPNRQIWLSSPVSGPKRFDLVVETRTRTGTGTGTGTGTVTGTGIGTRTSASSVMQWVYKRTSQQLHELLEQELSEAFRQPISFSKCAYNNKNNNNNNNNNTN